MQAHPAFLTMYWFLFLLHLFLGHPLGVTFSPETSCWWWCCILWRYSNNWQLTTSSSYLYWNLFQHLSWRIDWATSIPWYTLQKWDSSLYCVRLDRLVSMIVSPVSVSSKGLFMGLLVIFVLNEKIDPRPIGWQALLHGYFHSEQHQNLQAKSVLTVGWLIDTGSYPRT